MGYGKDVLQIVHSTIVKKGTKTVEKISHGWTYFCKSVRKGDFFLFSRSND